MPTVPGSLRSTARRMPGALAGLGLHPGDRFALMATNSDRFVVTFYAALRCGAIVVPVNPASAAPEIAYLLEDSGATVFAFDPADGASITLDDVRAFLRDRLTRYKIPHDVITGTIPRNPSGKILKHKLREAVARQQARES